MNGVVAVLLAAALFGTTGTAQALGPESTTPLTVGAARLAVGGLALLLVARAVDGAGLRRVLRHRAAWWGAVGVIGYQVCFFSGTADLGVATGTLVALGSAPLIAGLLAWAVGQGRPDGTWLVATAVAIAGLALLLGASREFDPVGASAALGAGLAYAVYTVAAKHLVETAGAGGTAAISGMFALGAVPALLVLLALRPDWPATPAGAGLLLYLGLVPTALAYLLFGRGVAVLPVGTVATLTLAEPVVAAVLGVAVLGESLTPVALLGALLVIGALALLGRQATRRPAGG